MLPDPTKRVSGVARERRQNVQQRGAFLMQKKLLAVAVAGALAAPAAAMAQSSVTISGAINIWYESAGASGATNSSTGAFGAPSTFDVKTRDRVQDGNGSNIRFTAVEDIGSGLQGFMQVESAVINNANTRNDAAGNAAQAVANTQVAGGWATRNSGVGLRGQAWGEVLIGVWDIHYNEQYPVDNQIIKGASHNSVLALMNSFGLAGSATTTGGVGNVSIGARYSNVIRYQSPNWSGFNFKVAYARPTDGNVNTTAGSALEGKKNTVFNIAPQWSNGPIFVGFSYLQDKDFALATSALFSGATSVVDSTTGAAVTTGGTANRGTVTSSRLSGAYTFPFGLKLGLIYDQSKLKMSSSGATAASPSIPDSEVKRNVWALPISFNTGAHTIFLVYSQSDKLKGSVGQANGASSDLSNVVVTPAGTGATAVGDVSSNSKAKFFNAGYQFDLSKRTNLHLSYSQIKNDKLAGYDFFANGVGMSGGSFGADPRIISLGLRHAF
jgi:predicted porin